MDINGVLKSVGKVQGEGAKSRQKITLNKTDNSGEVEVTVFLGGKSFGFSVGNELLVKAQEGEYNGKTQYSTNLQHIKDVGKPVSSIPVKEEKVNWDLKDRRMVRMNSYAHAVELVTGNFEMSYEDKLKLVKETAHAIEADIYRD